MIKVLRMLNIVAVAASATFLSGCLAHMQLSGNMNIPLQSGGQGGGHVHQQPGGQQFFGSQQQFGNQHFGQQRQMVVCGYRPTGRIIRDIMGNQRQELAVQYC